MEKVSDINEITVSGTICDPVVRQSRENSVFYTGLVRSVFYSKNGKMVESFHNVEAWGDLGKKLSQFRPGQKIVVKGRQTSFRGVSKSSGSMFVGYFKIQPTEIHFVEEMQPRDEPMRAWTSQPVDSSVNYDDVPF
jgi:single-stranded DNA-binding protein